FRLLVLPDCVTMMRSSIPVKTSRCTTRGRYFRDRKPHSHWVETDQPAAEPAMGPESTKTIPAFRRPRRNPDRLYRRGTPFPTRLRSVVETIHCSFRTAIRNRRL